jgi:hypothetical protein
VPMVDRTSPVEPPRPARKGTARIIGTTHRSWNTRMPTARRPWGAPISLRLESPCRTIAVLDTATTQPKNSAAPGANPNQLATPAAQANVTAT